MFRYSRFLCLILLLQLCFTGAFAERRKAVKKGNTEQTLINRLEGCLAQKDPYCYINLWPDMDTLSKIILEIADKNSKEYFEMQKLRENPVQIMRADSFFKANLMAAFDTIIANGEALGIHWEGIIPLRYEMVKQPQTRNQLSEKLAPTRFVGYLFFTDLVSRRSYGLMVGDILQIKNDWYGGQMRELYESSTRDEWETARMLARKQKLNGTDSTKTDSLKTASEEEEELKNKNRIIVDRKFYSGTFDNEIPVQLYVRSLKGGCPTGICGWEAIYKFGDQDDFIMLEVAKTAEGKWQMTEVPPNGVMDMELKEKTFTGTWTAADNQTGYDVRLTELPASAKKIQRLDAIFSELKEPK